jgi:hypothetical protein
MVCASLSVQGTEMPRRSAADVSLRNMSGERKYHAITFNPARRIAEASGCKAQPLVPSQRCLLAFTGVAGRSAAPLTRWQKSGQSWRSCASAVERPAIPPPMTRTGELSLVGLTDYSFEIERGIETV